MAVMAEERCPQLMVAGLGSGFYIPRDLALSYPGQGGKGADGPRNEKVKCGFIRYAEAARGAYAAVPRTTGS